MLTEQKELTAPIEVDEMMTHLRRMGKRKATGPDGISVELLLTLPRKALVALAHMMNEALVTGATPSQWKESQTKHTSCSPEC